MNHERPAVSVIIPTHNRASSLRRTLDALAAQLYSLRGVEVIVVADGCTDDTASLLRGYRASFSLRTVEQPAAGAAAARNRGADLAEADLLIFVDDDIEPVPSFIEAHLRGHERGEQQRVVIGYSAPILDRQRGFFRAELRGWWEAMFRRMAEPGHRFTYRDLLSGNVSMPAALFRRLDGFNETLRVHEDYELGVRLLEAGAHFRYAAAARGDHHEMTDLDRALRRKYDEGRADVQLARLHPALRPALPLARVAIAGTHRSRLLHATIAAQPAAADALARAHRRWLDGLEALGLRRRWRRAVDLQLGYWYRRGAMDEAGSARILRRLCEEISPDRAGPVHVDLDLRDGLVAAERCLDAQRPRAARIRYGERWVGEIPDIVGAEALRGAHLRPYLATERAQPLLGALAFEQLIEPLAGHRARIG